MSISRLDAKDYAKEHLKGLWGAATTPYLPDGSIDEAGLRANLRHWQDVLHLQGMYVGGWMGEFESLPVRDRKRLFEIAIEECKEMFALPASMDQNVFDALELLKYAEDLGAHFVALMNPRFYAPQMPNDEWVFQYYEYIAERVNLPIIMVNQDSLQGNRMSPQVLARLADIPNIVGLKNAVDDPVHSLETRRLCGHKMLVSDPYEWTWFQTHTQLGQYAFVAAPSVFLLQSRDWLAMREYTRLADEGDLVAAAKAAADLAPARRALKASMHKVGPDKHRAAMKLWQELLGQVGGCVRKPGPLQELTEAEKDFVRQQFATSGLLEKAAVSA